MNVFAFNFVNHQFDKTVAEQKFISGFDFGIKFFVADRNVSFISGRVIVSEDEFFSGSSDDILANIANKVDSNIRELEGVFNKIVARASLIHSPITREFAENIINEFKAENEKVISSDFIKETVGKYFSIDPNDLSGNKRSAEIAFPRQIAMYLCRKVAQMSLPQIGKDFGKRLKRLFRI